LEKELSSDRPFSTPFNLDKILANEAIVEIVAPGRLSSALATIPQMIPDEVKRACLAIKRRYMYDTEVTERDIEGIKSVTGKCLYPAAKLVRNTNFGRDIACVNNPKSITEDQYASIYKFLRVGSFILHSSDEIKWFYQGVRCIRILSKKREARAKNFVKSSANPRGSGVGGDISDELAMIQIGTTPKQQPLHSALPDAKKDSTTLSPVPTPTSTRTPTRAQSPAKQSDGKVESMSSRNTLPIDGPATDPLKGHTTDPLNVGASKKTPVGVVPPLVDSSLVPRETDLSNMPPLVDSSLVINARSLEGVSEENRMKKHRGFGEDENSRVLTFKLRTNAKVQQYKKIIKNLSEDNSDDTFVLSVKTRSAKKAEDEGKEFNEVYRKIKKCIMNQLVNTLEMIKAGQATAQSRFEGIV